MTVGIPTMGDRTPSKGTPVSFMKSDSGLSSGSPVRSTFYGPSYGRNGKKDHYETPNPRRTYTIMSQDDISQGKKSSWFELEITGTIRNLSPAIWQLSHLTSLYLNNNNLMRIPPDISRLEHLTFLDLSYNKLRSLPAELGDLANLRELFLSHNYLRVLPYELGKLFQLQNLGLKGNPLSPEILSVYNEVNGTSRLLSYMLDNLGVTASQPQARPWTTLAQPDRQRANLLFTCMSYNVLCDKYATRQIYGYCPSWALSWEYRKKGILDEIRLYAADIICLQEVETDQFYHFFLPELKQDGYDGVFSPKSRAKTMTVDERKHVDGCAIFFRASKFSLVKESLIEFNQIAIATADGTGSENMLNRVMTKDNIAISALLQTKDGAFDPTNMPDPSNTRQSVMVCTAHIHWDPEFSDVKLIQTMMLMKELKTILEDNCKLQFRPGAKTSQIDVSKIPLILCADLNSLPDSGPLEYIQQGFIPLNHTDFKDMAYEHCLSKMSCSDRTDVLAHPFKLKRSYGDDAMENTNYTFDFKGVIDYIFHSQPHMKSLGVLGPVDPNWFRENRIAGCPHPHVPSDHFPLLVEFELLLPPNGPPPPARPLTSQPHHGQPPFLLPPPQPPTGIRNNGPPFTAASLPPSMSSNSLHPSINSLPPPPVSLAPPFHGPPPSSMTPMPPLPFSGSGAIMPPPPQGAALGHPTSMPPPPTPSNGQPPQSLPPPPSSTPTMLGGPPGSSNSRSTNPTTSAGLPLPPSSTSSSSAPSTQNSQ